MLLKLHKKNVRYNWDGGEDIYSTFSIVKIDIWKSAKNIWF